MRIAAIILALTGSVLIALVLTAILVDVVSSALYHGGITR